jgi:RNA polymerase sigma-70 factor, ECF subfamily
LGFDYASRSASVGAEIDADLIRAIAGGSSDALARLYDRHSAVVYGLARRIVSRLEDAEEVVQDVFSQVWRDAARYERGRATVAGWLVMLTRTRAIDRVRARRSRPDVEAGVAPEAAPPVVSAERDPEQATIASDDARQVTRALTTLPPEQRALVEMAYYQGLTHSEIARTTGVPLGTVKTRLRTAMTTMREALSS